MDTPNSKQRFIVDETKDQRGGTGGETELQEIKSLVSSELREEFSPKQELIRLLDKKVGLVKGDIHAYFDLVRKATAEREEQLLKEVEETQITIQDIINAKIDDTRGRSSSVGMISATQDQIDKSLSFKIESEDHVLFGIRKVGSLVVNTDFSDKRIKKVEKKEGAEERTSDLYLEAFDYVFGMNRKKIELATASSLLEDEMKRIHEKKTSTSYPGAVALLLGYLYWERGDRLWGSLEVHRALELWTESSDERALFFLGRLHQDKGEETKAKEYWAKILPTLTKADHEDAWSQYMLGYLHQTGSGVTKNEREAVRLYNLAANEGHVAAEHAIALCFINGAGGMDRDIKEGLRWERFAADQGYAVAQNNLGRWLAHPPEASEGIIEKSISEAVKLYKLAAAQGLVEAQNNLALCYQFGTGIPADIIEAVRLYRLAAQKGLSSAQYNLGVCYEKGDGIPEDLKEAEKWYKLAGSQGHPKAKEALTNLTRKKNSWVGRFARKSISILKQVN